MKKIRNLAAAALAFILVSLLIAGCGGKISLQESQTQIPVSQNKNIAGENGGESDTYGFTHNDGETFGHGGESFDGSVNTTENTDPVSDRTTADDVSPPQSTTEPQNTDRPEPTQSGTEAPTAADEPKPTQAPTPKSTQAPAPKPEQKPADETTPPPAPAQKPTEPPSTSTATAAPVQPQPSTTLPITVSDAASVAAETVITAITNSGMSEFDKVKAIHDYIVVNVDYPVHIDMSNRSLFTAEGALVNKLAVCQGYAEAFSLLCHKAGIQTEMVYGTANNGQSLESHAWNIVRIDGVWYQIDTTWNDPITQNTAGGANLRYSYFLIPDSVMSQDHFADRYTHKYSCNDSRYLEYGELQTVAMLVKQNFGSVKYDFAASEADVKKIAADNYAAGLRKYAVVYNMGQKLNDSTAAAVNAKISDICKWIPEATASYSRISFQTMYQYGIKYVIVNVTIE